MAKIGLSDGFSLIPEGTHIFKITGVSYKEAFGKLEITMQTQSGAKHIERFSLLKLTALRTKVRLMRSAILRKPPCRISSLPKSTMKTLWVTSSSVILSMMFNRTRTSRTRPLPSLGWPISGPLTGGMNRRHPHPPRLPKPLLRPLRRLLRPLNLRVT